MLESARSERLSTWGAIISTRAAIVSSVHPSLAADRSILIPTSGVEPRVRCLRGCLGRRPSDTRGDRPLQLGRELRRAEHRHRHRRGHGRAGGEPSRSTQISVSWGLATLASLIEQALEVIVLSLVDEVGRQHGQVLAGRTRHRLKLVFLPSERSRSSRASASCMCLSSSCARIRCTAASHALPIRASSGLS